MKRHILTASIVVLAFCSSAIAQDDGSKGENDPKATEILNKVSAKYKAYSTIKTSFNLIIESAEEDFREEQKGIVWINGEKYKLDFGGQEVIVDNINQWTHLKDANEVQINEYEPDENTITPSQLFTLYEEGFLYRVSGSANVNGVSNTIIELTPIDKSKPFFKIKMFVDSKSSINQMIVLDKTGTSYTYVINKFEPNLDMPASMFKFDTSKFPGIEVVDLR